MTRYWQRGVTLVELIASIVVISVGLAGTLIVIDRSTRASGEPMVRHQAVAVAEAYLEEILLKSFCDPDAPGTCTGPGTCAPCAPGTQEGSRANYDNVCDYNGLNDVGARNQSAPNTVIAGLDAYRVTVAVDTNASLNGLTGGNCQVLGIQVDVAGPFGTAARLTGFRTNYN